MENEIIERKIKIINVQAINNYLLLKFENNTEFQMLLTTSETAKSEELSMSKVLKENEMFFIITNKRYYLSVLG